jgi:hypothetical protein
MLGRAVLAIGLMVGFYALALALTAGLFWIPYADWVYLHRVHPKIALLCLGAGGAILFAILPRVDKFEPPGPQLRDADHPRLFSLIRDVATATQQELPTEVYLLSDVNAWVTHRGGVMGIPSCRIHATNGLVSASPLEARLVRSGRRPQVIDMPQAFAVRARFSAPIDPPAFKAPVIRCRFAGG